MEQCMGKNKEKAARENKKKSVESSEFIHKVRRKIRKVGLNTVSEKKSNLIQQF